MSGVFLIGEDERAAIEAAIDAARAKPVPLHILEAISQDKPTSKLMLADRKPGATDFRKDYPSYSAKLGTYDCAISFEEQPHGLFKHLSVSSASKGKIPGPEVMKMACEAFGFSKVLCEAIGGGKALVATIPRFTAWLEEFEPGHMAINVLELENVTQ